MAFVRNPRQSKIWAGEIIKQAGNDYCFDKDGKTQDKQLFF